MSSTNCINCNSAIAGGQHFCGNCGQKAHVHRITLVHFLHEFFHAFTHTDRGIFHLLKGLATKPGVVAREYIEGKRKRYFNPFTFFIILMGIYVLSSQFFRKPEADREVPAQIINIPNVSARNEAIGMFKRGQQTQKFFSKGNIVGMIAIPVIAFVFWLCYVKRNYNYAEHLTANLMFTTFANLAFTLIVFPLQKLAADTPYYRWMMPVGFALQVIYYTWAYTGFLKIRTAGGKLKAVSVSMLAIISWFLFSTTIMAVYIYQSWDFYQFFGRMFGR
jgi:hypothetical protein